MANSNNPDTFLNSGNTTVAASPSDIFGADGTERVNILSIARDVVVDQNVERVDLPGNAADFTFQQAGNTLKVFTSGVLMATIPLQGDADGTQIAFGEGSVSATLVAGVMTLGGAPVSSTTGAVVPTTIDATTPSSTAPTTGTTETFSLVAAATSADEGTNAVFTLTTTNVADGTNVAYTLTGVDAADVTGGLTGTATVNGGTATITVPLVADATTEATAETLTVTLDGKTTTANMTVNDTSTDGIFTLTSSSDTIVGTDADEVIDASLQILSGQTVDTLGTGDNIDAGGGTDTVNAVVRGNPIANATPQNFSGVEILNLTNTVASNLFGIPGSFFFDLNKADSLTTLNFTDGLANSNIANIGGATAPTNFGITREAGLTHTVSVASAALAGTSDTATLTLDTVTDGDSTFTLAPNVVGSGYETINVASNGSVANTLGTLTDGGGTSLATINVTGSQALTLGGNLTRLDNSVTTLNASAATGNTTTFVGNSVLTATGGVADDTFDFATGSFVVAGVFADTIDGGAQTNADVLRVRDDADVTGTTAATQVTNVETLYITGAQLQGNVDMTHFGVNTLQLDQGIDNQARTITAATGNTLRLDNANNGANPDTAGGQYAYTVAGTGTTDTATLILNDADINTLSTITFNGVETLAINSNLNLNGTAADVGPSGQDSNSVSTLVMNSSGLNTVNVTGTETFEMGTTTVSIIDASGMAPGAALNVIAAGSPQAVSITGSAAADILIGGNIRDIIAGGNGNDTIGGSLGGDLLIGGNGADIFAYNVAGPLVIPGDSLLLATGGGFDTITDFVSGTDEIDLNINTTLVAQPSLPSLQSKVTVASANNIDLVTGISVAASAIGATAATAATALQTDIDTALLAAGGAAAAAGNQGDAVLFTLTGTSAGGNNMSYLVVEVGAVNGGALGQFDLGVDTLIALTGVTDLQLADFV